MDIGDKSFKNEAIYRLAIKWNYIISFTDADMYVQ